MNYLLQHWSFDPFAIIAIVLVGWHETGLARLARRSPADQARQRRRRSLWFYGGLAVSLLAVQSPIDYWAYDYFFMHMIQHLLLMFAAPVLIVAGAPWQPLLDALPEKLRRAAASVSARGWFRPVRAIGVTAVRPWVSVAIFNAVMLGWHVPALLDESVRNHAVAVWLLHPSFVVAGLLFWLQFIPSAPFRSRMSPAPQAAALVLTNVIMWLLAMAMGILTSASWYSVYNHIPGVTLPAFADQQIGAGILWICGDFWAIPALVVVVRRLINEEGGAGAAVDRMLGRGSSRYRWAERPLPADLRSLLEPAEQHGQDYQDHQQSH
jgi:putative membrane protein